MTTAWKSSFVPERIEKALESQTGRDWVDGLGFGFSWASTPEGFEFWDSLPLIPPPEVQERLREMLAEYTNDPNPAPEDAPD